ncbi:hypothetical protein D9619_003406 [Psilocybe cf. subviscida]|uniref:Uncharacterized protein n=1 Tax=Psilocybe cf. subviscida TaxID=2480587 RepID=A0A8H5ETP7_9AGAR|nr:hypothetical protein D9619_003406 [Psilocybe cf. subviscida]
MPAVISSASAGRWILGDDSASAVIRYTGPWSVADSRRDANSRRSAMEVPGANTGSSARWIDSNGSLSVDFSGYEASLIGGMSFTPTTDFAFCTIDGATVPMGSTGDAFAAANSTPLCHITGLAEGPHVLTFNLTNIGAEQGSMSESSDSKNRQIWIDGFSYATTRLNLAARQAPSSSSASSTAPSATPTSANNGTTNTDPTDSGTSSKTAVRIGEIAGGIIGGALLVVFLRGLFFYVQRNDGTRTAVGRPASPTYESGWTLPKLGKSGGKGGGLKKGADSDVSGEDAKQAQEGTHAAGDVPLSPLKADDSKAPAQHAS